MKELPELIQCAQCIRDIRWALQKSDLEALGFALGYITEIEPERRRHLKSKNFGVGWTPKSRAEFLQAKHEFMDALVCRDLKSTLDAGAILEVVMLWRCHLQILWKQTALKVKAGSRACSHTTADSKACAFRKYNPARPVGRNGW